MRKMHQPVIAAINGPAIGGGFCLSLAADIRIASQSAFFRAAGVNNGLTSSELGLSYLLPRAIGSSRAFELMLTGPRPRCATEAGTIGLVSRVVAATTCSRPATTLAQRIIGLEPGRDRADQAHAVVEPRRLEPPVAHEPRGRGTALRAADHPELRRGRAGPQGEAATRFND